MKRLIIAVVSLNLGLVGLSGGVLAQTNSGVVVIDDASGTNGSNGACEVSRPLRDRTVTCGDLQPDPGITETDPPAEPAPSATDAAPTTPEAESAPETTDTAVASATDQDADNAPDELEPGLGLDPTNPDSDGDGVADGDEPNLYGTDPGVWDTDGDSHSDGEELFTAGTDPLVWDNNTGDASVGGVETAPSTESVVEESAAPDASSVDSDTDRLADADEAAFGTDPTTPDADGDGYYDGDEVNLGTDPLDPVSFPAEELSPASP
jgi:Bacterial TSP3 repeat